MWGTRIHSPPPKNRLVARKDSAVATSDELLSFFGETVKASQVIPVV